MCRFHIYRNMLAEKSPRCRENMIEVLRKCRHDNSLSRIVAARGALLNLKTKLKSEESPDVHVAIRQAIEQLETTT